MDAISPHETRLSPEFWPIIYIAHIIVRAPLRQPAVKLMHATKHVITTYICHGAREDHGVEHSLGVCTHRFNINFSDLRLTQVGVVTAHMDNNLIKFTVTFSQQFKI